MAYRRSYSGKEALKFLNCVSRGKVSKEECLTVEWISLSEQNVYKVPDSIGELTNLTVLHMSHTNITELPYSIGNLTNLTTLGISNTHITELPDWIGKLTNLTSLYINYTHITELPDWIGNLTNLTTLGISNTHITELPDWIGKLTNLTWLYIGELKLDELPPKAVLKWLDKGVHFSRWWYREGGKPLWVVLGDTTLKNQDIDVFLRNDEAEIRSYCEEQIGAGQGTVSIHTDEPEQSKSIQAELCGKTVFISYSWDSDEYKARVRSLSDRLERDGIKTILDQKDLVLGDEMPLFMEESIGISDYVLILCTPKYKEKADSRSGGTGYEESVITGDIMSAKDSEERRQIQRKYITVLTDGEWAASTPIWAMGKYGPDLREDGQSKEKYEEQYAELVKTIKGGAQ